MNAKSHFPILLLKRLTPFQPTGGKLSPLGLLHLANFIGALLALTLLITFAEETRYTDRTSIAPTTVLVSIYIASTFFSWRFQQQDLAFVNSLFSIHIWPRLIQYSVWPDSVEMPATNVTAQEVTAAIWRFDAYMATFYASVMLTSFLLVKRAKPFNFFSDKNVKKMTVCLLALIAAAMFENFYFIQLANSPYIPFDRQIDTGTPVLKFLITVLSQDTALLLLLLFGYAAMKGTNKSSQALLISAVLLTATVFFILSSSSLGSRGGGIKILTWLLVLTVIFRESWRLFLLSACIAVTCLSLNFVQYDKITISRSTLTTDAQETDAGTNIPKNFAGQQSALITVMNRLGIFDYLIVTLSRPAEENCRKNTANLTTQIKAIGNWVAIGTPFPEAKRQSPAAFHSCFRPEFPSQSRLNNEIWTTPGIFHQFFQPFSLLLMAVFGGFIVCLNHILKFKVGRVGQVLNAFSLPTLSGLALFAMGLDHAVVSTATVVLRVSFLLLGCWLLLKLTQGFHPFKEKNGP